MVVSRLPRVLRTVELVVVRHGRPVRSAEVRELVELELGSAVKRATVKAALCDLAMMTDSPVTRAGHGLYSARDSDSPNPGRE